MRTTLQSSLNRLLAKLKANNIYVRVELQVYSIK